MNIKNILGNQTINWMKVQAIIFITAFAVLCGFINHRIDNFIDSDIASQMVLSRLLAEEGSLLSSNWYYATELRVFSCQLVFTPLFFLTSDWHTVRIAGSIIHYLLMLLGLYYMCCQMKLRKYFFLLGLVFMLPFSETYFSYVLRNINYIPIITISFFAIGMMTAYAENDCPCGKKLFLLAVSAVLALCSGMNGLRQSFVLYIPLASASVLLLIFRIVSDRSRLLRFTFISVWAVCFAWTGCLINALYLSKKYSYSTFEAVAWKRVSIDGIVSVLNGWMENLGYCHGSGLFSDSILHNAVCAVIIGIAVYAVYHTLFRSTCCKFEAQVMAGYLVCGLLCSAVLYSVTNMPYMCRYDLPVSAFLLSGDCFIFVRGVRGQIQIENKKGSLFRFKPGHTHMQCESLYQRL